MGTYTQHESRWIDEQIELQLQSITNKILENVKNVKSVIITGGFGKGEGTVEITREKKIIFLRDFDIVVIVDQIPKQKVIQRLYDQIYSSLYLRNPEYKLFRHNNFAVDLKLLRKKDLIYPDIWFYDLKAGSQILYGEDVRNLISWSKKDVPLSSGLRILFEKVCGLLGYFSYTYIKSMKLPEENKKSFILECHKTFIEICTALCILNGKYETKYIDRLKNFNKFYYNDLGDLAKVLPDLPKKVEKYTNFKLKPDFTKIYEDPIDLWFSARNYLGKVLNFYLRKYVGIILLDWKDLPKHMKKIAFNYYKPFLNPLIHAKLKISNNVISNVSNILYQVITNLEYAYVVTRYTDNVYLHPLLKSYISPSLKFFPAGIMILFSLNRDGTINREYFKKAMSELRHCIPLKVSTLNASEWDVLRNHFLRAYKLYEQRGFHFVK